MYKFEAIEAAPMCTRVLRAMLTQAPTRGQSGSDLRTAVGDFIANSLSLLQNDEAGPPLNAIYILARETGIDFFSFDEIRKATVAEAPVTVGAFIVKNMMIELSLATQCEIVANMVFVSRDDVDAVRARMNDAFAPMENIAADEMAQDTYQALIHLHAALAYHLAQTARPLPRMLRYQFYSSLPSVVTAYKLYSDASRCDELRAENKIVHPAFCPREGKALSN
jgi:prophage DNA circulation protein